MMGDGAASPVQNLIDTVPCGYLTYDARGQITASNARLRDWLDLSSADIQAMQVIQVFSMASRVVFETSVAPLLQLSRQVDGASLDLLAKDGTKVPVLFSAETTGEGDQCATSMILMLANARRNFERDLAAERAAAEAEVAAMLHERELREQFVAILGHDLRNPLASIKSAVRILSREDLSPRGEQIIHLTEGSVSRMSLLIDNILDFARNRLGGGIDLNLSDGAMLNDEIRQVVSELSTAHPDRDIQVDYRADGAVQCDVARIGQLLSNLLGNALTYGHPAHSIAVNVAVTDADGLTLSVSNQGTPIPQDAMDRLFDPYMRSTNHTDRAGLGLGLYIAAEIAKAHQGRIDVQSDAAMTTFTLQIPAARAGAAGI